MSFQSGKIQNCISHFLIAIYYVNLVSANYRYDQRNYYYYEGFDNDVLTYADSGKLAERDLTAAEPRVLTAAGNVTGNVLAGLTLFEAPNGALAFIINYGLAVS